MLLTAVLAFSAVPVHAVETAKKSARPIIGAVEYVDLDDAGLIVKARIDTGAGLTSINAKIVELRPPADGKPERVVFRIVDKQASKKTLVRNVVEWVNIKRNSGSIIYWASLLG